MMLAEEVNELWKWPNFALLAFLLGYMIKKQGGAFLAARSAEIRESLEAGKKAQAEAEKPQIAIAARMCRIPVPLFMVFAFARAGACLVNSAPPLLHWGQGKGLARWRSPTSCFGWGRLSASRWPRRRSCWA